MAANVRMPLAPNSAEAGNGLPFGPGVPNYELLEILGAGGMGIVYKARDRTLGRLAALKFLLPQSVKDPSARDRLIHEARAASTLDHPNICTIFEIGETAQRQLFIAMPFYEGGTVADRMTSGQVGIDQVISWGVQIASGLAAAHQKGIIHRDIKPSNVALTRDGIAKILDFGIAKVTTEDETEGPRTKGTFAYMSPEQHLGEAVDLRTDIWSLGILLFEALTGSHPFRGEYRQALVYSILNSVPQAIAEFRTGVPRPLADCIERALRRKPSDRFADARTFAADLGQLIGGQSAGMVPPLLGSEVLADVSVDGAEGSVFLSYARSNESDGKLAAEIAVALGAQNDVFLDDPQLDGSGWVARARERLSDADFLICLLSPEGCESELVLAEIEAARRLRREREDSGGPARPVILPIRVAMSRAFSYPLRDQIQDMEVVSWTSEEDTPWLIARLLEATSGGRFRAHSDGSAFFVPAAMSPTYQPPRLAAQPLDLEFPEGTMDPQSVFYVERAADRQARRAIERGGATITIKGPRQVGKSSLLMRIADYAASLDRQLAVLDFQLIAHDALSDGDVFFHQFLSWLTDELSLEDRVDEYWKSPLGVSQRATRYMLRHVLSTLDRPVVLAMDEVDRIFEATFRNDFFAMLRSWHNSRRASSPWRHLDMVLVTSTEPYELIANLSQSPFNVGEVLDLTGFTLDEVRFLNAQHRGPFDAVALKRLIELLGGHPYLTRRAMYLVAAGINAADEVLSRAIDEQGPFGDHLRHHLYRLFDKGDLLAALRGIITTGRCDDERAIRRLRGAGLVSRTPQGVVPRCELYSQYFAKHLNA